MLYIHVRLSRSRFCDALCSLCACAHQFLRPIAYVVASVPLVDCLGVTTCEIHLCDVGVLDVCDVRLTLLAMCHLFGFLCFFASLHVHA